jgi:hypothetical protein
LRSPARTYGFAQSYILPVKFQIDYRRATLSSQICAGEISREEALEILKTPPFDAARAQEEKVYVAKKFGINDGRDGRHPGGPTEDAPRLPEQSEGARAPVRGVLPVLC